MKKLIFIIALFCATIIAGAQIHVNSNGYVGINHSNPSLHLDVNGYVRIYAPNSSYGGLIFDNSGYSNVTTLRPADDWCGSLGSSTEKFNVIYSDHVITRQLTENSDEKLKENIKTLEESLNKIKKIRGVSYDFRSDYFNISDVRLKEKLKNESKNQVGFLAQELINIFPEAVFFDSTNSTYSIRYTSLIPVLVEAIKEQQAKIDELENRIGKLEGKGNEKSAGLATGSTAVGNEPATLAQNVPNPFSTTTRIGIFLPTTVNHARLYVYNMQGAQIKSFNINERGNTHVTIEGYSLEAGMYLYTLIADGKEVDTKKMILTK